MLGDWLVKAFGLLPPRLRERLKISFGIAGHGGSYIDAWRARRLSQTWRRPERIVQDISVILDGLGTRSLDGQRVMDFGAGILMADAFAYAMFGAAEVHAVDYSRLLQPKVLRDYAAQSGWHQFRPILAERRGAKAVDDWFRRLSQALNDPADDWFRHLGIRYVAPFDILTEAAPAQTYDLIASRSTLEHLPVELASPIVVRLGEWIGPGGAMYHAIHLADHRDIAGNPYGFLTAGDDFSPQQHDLRGNGLRASDWRRIFARLDFDWSEITEADDIELFPKKLAPRLSGYEREDLLLNHYNIFGHRRRASQ